MHRLIVMSPSSSSLTIQRTGRNIRWISPCNK